MHNTTDHAWTQDSTDIIRHTSQLSRKQHRSQRGGGGELTPIALSKVLHTYKITYVQVCTLSVALYTVIK